MITKELLVKKQHELEKLLRARWDARDSLQKAVAEEKEATKNYRDALDALDEMFAQYKRQDLILG